MNHVKPHKKAMVCLAMVAGFTWLNPHVWLDMLMIVGASAQSTPMDFRVYFLGGVALSSALWFLSLGYGAKYLRPYFENPRAWQILDGLTAIMMLGIALSLSIQLFT
jgi:L-lysine exporter family protein LysE/ArgO